MISFNLIIITIISIKYQDIFHGNPILYQRNSQSKDFQYSQLLQENRMGEHSLYLTIGILIIKANDVNNHL